MKVGDLWVKLGLKKDEFSKGMKQAGNETKSFSDKMKSMAGAAKIAWAAVAAAVTKFVTDAVKMTQRWGDQWNQTMAGVKAAYGSFVRQLSSGEGWTNLFQNMAEAYRMGREIAAVLDEVFERKISYGYQAAETEKEIAAQQLIMRDSSKSNAERQAAAKRIIELEAQLGETKKDIAQQEAGAMREQFKLQTRMNDEQIDFLVKEYNQNRDVINQAREYLRVRKELESTTGQSFFTQSASPLPAARVGNTAQDAALKRLEEETPQYIKDVAELTKMYDKGNDELVKGMADAEVAVINVDTEVMNAQTRATALLGTLSKAGEETKKAATDWKKVFESIDKELNVKLHKMPDLTFEAPEVEIDDDFFEFNLQTLIDGLERAKEFADELHATIAGGVTDAIQELADQFAGLEQINPGRVLQALLTPLADMAVREGEILIAQGIGIEACKEALEKLNGWAAIAAGTALVAIGAAAKSGLAALAKSGAGSTATTAYSGGSSSAAQVQTIQTEMTVYVTGRLSGSDILLSGQKTQNNWNR